MRMLAGLGVALVLAAVGYADSTHHAGLGQVARCLRGAGATVEPSAAAPWRSYLTHQLWASLPPGKPARPDTTKDDQ